MKYFPRNTWSISESNIHQKENQEVHILLQKIINEEKEKLVLQVELFSNQIPMTIVKQKEMKIVVYTSLSFSENMF